MSLEVSDRAFWAGRRVLVTGHTGFKGGWLALWLSRLGARVTGLALAPHTRPSLHALAEVDRLLEASHVQDLRDARGVADVIRQARPEVVFHLAAQALVRPGYRDPLATFATNIMGSAHVLDALRGLDSVRAAVIVTTDKVYRNREWPHPYREGDELGGHDPYSASKAAAELVTASYRDAFLTGQGVAVATARAGNVIGGGDWSEDRLLPDAVRAWQAGAVLAIRRPDATRPWQHVLEPLAGYLALARALVRDPALAGAWNFGPPADAAATVREVVTLAARAWPGAQVEFQAAPQGPHEAGLLALDVAQARARLGVRARWDLAQSVRRTLDWHRQVHLGASARACCEHDLDAYEALLP